MKWRDLFERDTAVHSDSTGRKNRCKKFCARNAGNVGARSAGRVGGRYAEMQEGGTGRMRSKVKSQEASETRKDDWRGRFLIRGAREGQRWNPVGYALWAADRSDGGMRAVGA